ncbi:hypothetical protein RF11_07269 [Thelohanellus kitauei]|uniref:MULE transposase domain-containing protein n=1 Tax=Thelohanellus kitauei TaxID=669202 RepID=A0A0C2N712_THEKT|nr:hypothetical protein RF11_07269 [Thelohanellus kitauei]
MAVYPTKKRHGLDLLIRVVLSIKAWIVCVDLGRIEENLFHRRRNKIMAQILTKLMLIVSSIAIGINQSTTSALPALPSMNRLVQWTLRDAITPLSRRNSFASIVLTLECTLSHMSEQFLLYFSGEVENRILIFSTNNNLELLRSSDCWYCEKNFKAASSPFSQLYTIHCKINNTVIPIVYGLLPAKFESIYTPFFTAISNLKPDLSPATILLDVETSSHYALRRVFPQTIIKGCYYKLWQKDGDFVITAKMILGICFVPITDICFAFEKLLFSNFSVNDAEILNCLSDYSQDFYIDRILRLNIRRAPLFPHSLWNCHDPLLATISKLNEIKITQLQSGMVALVESNRYKDHNQRLANIVNTYRRENNFDDNKNPKIPCWACLEDGMTSTLKASSSGAPHAELRVWIVHSLSRTRLPEISRREPLNPLRENEFIPSFSRDSVSSGGGASNEEAKSVSPLRADIPQTEIDRQQAQDS